MVPWFPNLMWWPVVTPELAWKGDCPFTAARTGKDAPKKNDAQPQYFDLVPGQKCGNIELTEEDVKPLTLQSVVQIPPEGAKVPLEWNQNGKTPLKEKSGGRCRAYKAQKWINIPADEPNPPPISCNPIVTLKLTGPMDEKKFDIPDMQNDKVTVSWKLTPAAANGSTKGFHVVSDDKQRPNVAIHIGKTHVNDKCEPSDPVNLYPVFGDRYPAAFFTVEPTVVFVMTELEKAEQEKRNVRAVGFVYEIAKNGELKKVKDCQVAKTDKQKAEDDDEDEEKDDEKAGARTSFALAALMFL